MPAWSNRSRAMLSCPPSAHRIKPSGDSSLDSCSFSVFLQPAQVELHLSLVGSFELAEFQFDRDQPPQATMIEKQIKGVVFAVDHHSLLTGNETESASHLQQKGFNVAKNSGL